MLHNYLIFVPEMCVFILSILLIVFATMNRNISPPPSNLQNTTENYGKIYCIPVSRLDISDLTESQDVNITMNRAYQLMVVSFVSGILLLVLSLIMTYLKMKGHCFIPSRYTIFAPN